MEPWHCDAAALSATGTDPTRRCNSITGNVCLTKMVPDVDRRICLLVTLSIAGRPRGVGRGRHKNLPDPEVVVVVGVGWPLQQSS